MQTYLIYRNNLFIFFRTLKYIEVYSFWLNYYLIPFLFTIFLYNYIHKIK